MIPEQLLEEVADLRKVGYQVQLQEVGHLIYILFENFKLPANGYNVDSTTLMVFTANNYPNCAFDMFWVLPELTLKNGGFPHASTIDSQIGRSWRRFSIHPYQHVPWNPGVDNLRTYLTYIDQRLNHLS